MTAQDGKSKTGSKNDEKTARKEPVFRDIEDVISIGALLRPTISQAVAKLKSTEREELKQVLIDVERELSNSSRTYRARFERTREVLKRTYGFAPIWRFIAGRIDETWTEVESPSVKELSIVSLLVGMMFEENEARSENRAKTKRSA